MLKFHFHFTGTKSKIFAPANPNRPDTHNNNHDIAGSRSRVLHFALDKPYGSLINGDIDGTQPNCVKFKTKREPQNPLCPVYKLQQVEYIAPDPPKFIRDNINVHDIEGSKPKIKKQLAFRDSYNINDIVGARPKPPMERKELHDQYYNDVIAKKVLNR